jgi:hypothetical protein
MKERLEYIHCLSRRVERAYRRRERVQLRRIGKQACQER